MLKTVYLSILLLLTVVIASPYGSSAATQDKELIRAVPFGLIGSEVPYDGVEATADDVSIHYDALTHRGRNYYWSDAVLDGLFVDVGTAPSKVYQPYELAVRAGWYEKSDDSDACNNVWGLWKSGGKIWMGTDGLGILAFDPRRSMWLRYDSQLRGRPGAQTFLYFLDEKYMFFYGPESLLVYSWKHHSCAELARPIDHRIDLSHANHGSPSLRFKSRSGKASYYAALEREFSGIKR